MAGIAPVAEIRFLARRHPLAAIDRGILLPRKIALKAPPAERR